MPKAMKSFSPIFVLLVALAGAWCLLWSTSEYGCATTPDSASYLAAARSLVAEGALRSYDGSPVALWPPLYSALLAIGRLAAPLTTTGCPRIIGCLLYFCTILLFARWLAEWITTRWIRAIGVGLVASSTTLFLFMGAILSEGLFIFIIALFFFISTTTALSPRKQLFFLFAIASLAVLTRYIGITLYLLVGLWIIINGHFRRLTRRDCGVIMLCGATLLPISGVLVRNVMLSGHLTGARNAALFPILNRATSALDITSQFIMPAFIPLLVRASALFLMMGIAALLFFHHARGSASPLRTSGAMLIAWLLIYPSALLLLGTTGYMDMPDFRLMSPLLLPVMAVLVYVCDFIVCNYRRTVQRLAICGLLLLCIVLALHRAIKYCHNAHVNGIGMYTSREWSRDELIKDLTGKRLNGKVFSNAPDAIYLNTLRPVSMLPLKGDLDWKVRFSNEIHRSTNAVYVAWWKDFWRQYTMTPSDISHDFDLTVVKTYKDAILFSIEADH